MALKEHQKRFKKNRHYIPYPDISNEEKLPQFGLIKQSAKIPTYDKRCNFWKKSLNPHTINFEKKYQMPVVHKSELDLTNTEDQTRHNTIVNFYKQIEMKNYSNVLEAKNELKK